MAEDEQATETKKEEEQTQASKNIVTIEEAGPCKKKVIILLPEESIKAATYEQYETLRKVWRISWKNPFSREIYLRSLFSRYIFSKGE